MYYRITDDAALRSWTDIGYGVLWRDVRRPIRLTRGQGEVMAACDAEHDLETDATVMYLVLKGLIEPCERGQAPSSWSAYRRCDNPCFPMVNLMITGRCNLNCLHCFNAADNAAIMTQWSFEDLCDLFDQARDCGVTSFQITGGEPMVHPRFLDIIAEIYARHMTVFALNTNGWLVTRELLDELAAIGCRPDIKISFDGVGFHDWIRQREGAEERAVRAMELCLENGFRVASNTQVNRKNVHTMMATAELLDGIGVNCLRVIRTTEVPRWEANAQGACLSIDEYYASMLDFAAAYARSGMQMDVEVWQYVGLLPKKRSFYLKPVKFPAGSDCEGGHCCNCTNVMAAVTSSGEIVTCNQASGTFLKKGMTMGNLHRTPLAELLGGDFSRVAKMTAGELRDLGSECGSCRHFRYCGGGCRAMGYLYSDDASLSGLLGKDVTKCSFFDGGWYERVTQALSGWRNLSDIGASSHPGCRACGHDE